MNVHGGEQFLKLGLVQVQGSMTADQCIKTLNTRLAQHGLTLENDIVAIITDGPNVIYGKGRKTCQCRASIPTHTACASVWHTVYIWQYVTYCTIKRFTQSTSRR